MTVADTLSSSVKAVSHTGGAEEVSVLRSKAGRTSACNNEQTKPLGLYIIKKCEHSETWFFGHAY